MILKQYKFEMVEHRWAADFINLRTAQEFLEKATEIVGGGSLFHTPSLIYTTFGVDDSVCDVNELFALVDSFQDRTKSGFMRVRPKYEELGFLLPLQKNPDQRGHRDDLFPGLSFGQLLLQLQNEFGPCIESRGRGLWFDDGEVFADENRVLLFPECSVTSAYAVNFIRENVLMRKDCDQHCLYVSRYGQATLIYRNDAEQVEVREAA